MLLIPAGVVTAYFHVVAGLGIAAVGLVAGWLWMALWQTVANRVYQKALKKVLERVPIYRQMLARYPDTVVVIPRPKQGP
jgi:hypothetical protein